MRYLVEYVEQQGDIGIYKVTDTKRDLIHYNPSAGHWHTDVWVTEDVRCVNCYGPMVAMSASCPHVGAVKRHLKTLKESG